MFSLSYLYSSVSPPSERRGFFRGSEEAKLFFSLPFSHRATYCKWFGEERRRRSHQRWFGGGSCSSLYLCRGAWGDLRSPSWDSAAERSWERRGQPSGCREPAACSPGSCRDCFAAWLSGPSSGQYLRLDAPLCFSLAPWAPVSGPWIFR